MAESIVCDTVAKFTNNGEPYDPPAGSGIKRFERWNGWCYTGPRAALTVAGLVPPDAPFPGDRPGRHRCQFVSTDGRKASIAKGPQGLFCVSIYWTDADQDRRNALRKEAERRAAMAEAAAKSKDEEEKAAAELAELPATGAAFAQRAADVFWVGYQMFRCANCQPKPTKSGYRFSAADVADFDAIASRLYWEIRNTEPRFDAAARMSKITEARAKSAKANFPLQQLLMRASEPAPTDRRA